MFLFFFHVKKEKKENGDLEQLDPLIQPLQLILKPHFCYKSAFRISEYAGTSAKLLCELTFGTSEREQTSGAYWEGIRGGFEEAVLLSLHQELSVSVNVYRPIDLARHPGFPLYMNYNSVAIWGSNRLVCL